MFANKWTERQLDRGKKGSLYDNTAIIYGSNLTIKDVPKIHD